MYSYLRNILLNVSYSLPGVFENNPYANAVNGSLWSLPIEVLFYFIPPALHIIKNDKARKTVIFLVTITSLIMSIMVQFKILNIDKVFYGTALVHIINTFPYFMIGVLFANFNIVNSKLNCSLALILIIFFQVIPSSFILLISIVKFTINPYCIFSIAYSNKMKISNLFDENDITYGIFLYGFLVQQTIVYIINQNNMHLSFGLTLIISYTITVGLSCLNLHFIEKPTKKLLYKLLKS